MAARRRHNSARFTLCVSLLVFALVLAPARAHAIPISWASAVSGNWNDPTKWSPPQVPGASDDVTISVPGTYTVTFNVSTPAVNSLTLGDATGVQTLTAASRGLSLAAASVINAGGVIDFTSSTINGPGVLTNQGTMLLRASTVGAPLDNFGLIVAHGTTAFNGAITTESGSTMRVEGDATSGGGILTIAAGFTNNGTIELTNSAPNQGATLNVSSGTLVNAATHAINVLAGAGGGGRTLGAELNNQGALSAAIALTINKGSAHHTSSGSITMSGADLSLTLNGTGGPSFTETGGSITLDAGHTLAVSGGAFNYNGGTLGSSGALLSLTNATLSLGTALSTASIGLDFTTAVVNGPATLTNAAATTVVTRSTNVTAPIDNFGVLDLRGTATVSGTITTESGSTLRIEGDVNSGGALITVSNGFTNNGAIELTNNSLGQGATLNVTNGTLVNAPSSTIRSLVGAGGGGRTLGAELNNQGTFSTALATTINRNSSHHQNSGSISVSGGDLTLSMNGTSPSFTQSAGSITLDPGRTLAVGSGTFNYNGGTLGSPGALLSFTNSTLALGAPLSTASIGLVFNTATVNGPSTLTNAAGVTVLMRSITLNAPVDNFGVLDLRATGSLNGALTTEAGDTLRVDGDGSSGSALITVANGFTNNGTIELTNVAAAQGATLNVTSGTLVNAAGHAINVLAGAGGGPRTIGAELNNQGSLSTVIALLLNKPSAHHVNSGSITVSGVNLALTMNGSAPSFTQAGGSITLDPSRSLIVTGGTFNYNAGTLGPPAATMSFGSSSTLALNAPLSTASIGLSFSSSTLNGPSTLTNAAGVSVLMLSTTVNAPVDNFGVLDMRGSSALNGALTTENLSTLRASGDGSFGGALITVANGFTNNGTIELTNNATSTGATLNVTAGTLTNAAAGALNALAGAGGGNRTLGAQLDNQGVVNVGSTFTLNKASAHHTNSGTVNVSGADLTLTQSGSSPTFATTGAFSVSSGRTLTVSGGAFNFTAGTFSGAGSAMLVINGGAATMAVPYTLSNLTVSNGTFNTTPDLTTAATACDFTNGIINGPGSFINAAGQSVIARASAFNAAVDNAGLLVVRGTSAINGTFTSEPDDTLRVQGDPQFGSSLVTVANGFTNNGVIDLTNSSVGQGATLTVTTGTLTNAATRAINALPGAGSGARSLAAQLDNQGTVTVLAPFSINRGSGHHTNSGTFNLSGADLTLNQTGTLPSFTTTGVFAIAPGRTLTVTGGAFNFNAGTLGGPGSTLLVNSSGVVTLAVAHALSSLIASSGTIATTPDLTTSTTACDFTSATINGPGKFLNAAGRVVIARSTAFNDTVDNAGLLVVRGTSNFNNLLTTEPDDTLRIQGDNLQGAAVVTVANSLTNNGIIELTNDSPSQGATLNLTAGTLTNAPGRFINSLPGAGAGNRALAVQLDNQGTLNILASLTFGRASAHHTNSGTINLNGADFTLIQSGTLPSFDTSGSLVIASGHTLFVQGGAFNFNGGALGGPGSALNAASSATIALTQPHALSSITVSSATLNSTPDLNTANTALDLSTATVNGPGNLINAAGHTVIARASTINDAFDNAGLLVLRGQTAINGSLTTEPDDTLRIQGDNVLGLAIVTVLNGFTNNGVIELTNTLASVAATLNVTNGTLTNAPTRQINTLAGAGGGGRTIGAQLDNQGVMSIGIATSINKPSAHHTSSGAIQVTGGDLTMSQSGTASTFTNSGDLVLFVGRTLHITAGTAQNAAGGTIEGAGTLDVLSTTFTNNGNLNPGSSTGILTINGSPVFGPTSAVNVQVGGPLPDFNYDRLIINGTVQLNGVVNISLINGFVPSPGETFQVVAWTTDLGSFASFTGLVLGGGLSFAPQMLASNLSLLTIGQTWVRQLPTGTAPFARAGHSAVFDSIGNRMIVFGGASASSPLNDVWVLTQADGSGGPGAWTKLNPTGGPPPARAHHSAVYNVASNQMIVFGGDNATGPTPATFTDLWLLSNANGLGGTPTWSQVAPDGAPPPARTNHSAAYDAASDRMIVFGGDSSGVCGSERNDVWVLANATGAGGTPTWSALAPLGGPPSARSHAMSGYDYTNNRLTIVGGSTECGASNLEMWVLADANGAGSPAWTQVTPSGPTPSPWSLQSGVFDASDDRLTAFAGLTAAGLTDTVLTLFDANGDPGTPMWVYLSPTTYTPPPRSFHSAVQATNHRMVIFAGQGPASLLADVWVLEETQGRVVSVPLPPVLPPGTYDRVWTTGFSRSPSPNPAISRTQFAITVARTQHVQLSIVDVAGRHVATLFSGSLERGEHAFDWRGETDGGRAAAGLYFLRFDAEQAHLVRKVVLTR